MSLKCVMLVAGIAASFAGTAVGQDEKVGKVTFLNVVRHKSAGRIRDRRRYAAFVLV